MARMALEHDVTTGVDYTPPVEVVVHMGPSCGWAEIRQVNELRPDGTVKGALMAIKPSGGWYWIRRNIDIGDVRHQFKSARD